MGTVTEVYDSDGNLLWKENYTAFGKASGTETDEFDEAFGFSAMFTGCQEDRETGLSYHWNRWRSEDGRSFITQDPARDGINWYGYAGQNPVTYKDPTGLAYYGPDGVHSSSEALTPHGETNKNVTPSVPDTSAMPQNLNILLVPIDDAEAIDKAVNAYFGGLKDGVAGNAPVDGIGLVDMNGNTIHIFTNDESISKFNEALGYNAEPNWTNADYASEIETFVDTTGTIITLANVAKIPGMERISFVAGAASTLIDYKKTKDNPTVSNAIDLGLDIIGFFGIKGALLSIYGSCVKTEVEIWAQTMAEGTVEFNNRAKQYQYEKMMEEMERYEQ